MTLEYSLSLNTAFLYEDPVEGEEETHSEGEEAHSGEEEVVNPVIPELPEIFWALGLFALLYALMRYVLVPPIKAGMVERENKIRSARDAADKVASDMGSAQADYDAAVAGAREEANAIIEAARDEANAYRTQVHEAASAEILELKNGADVEIAAARATAMSELRGDVSQMAVAAASSVVGSTIDPSAAQATIDQILDGGAA